MFRCEQLAADCLTGAAPPDEAPEHDDCDLADGEVTLPPCADQVTIGAIERCLDQLIARAHDLVDTVSCATAVDLVVGLPPACAAVDAACPGLVLEK